MNVEIALVAHSGQTDKAGAPYILHPLRLMLAQETDAARIAGVLYDVVEDSAEGMLDFVSFSSPFYPELARYYAGRFQAWAEEARHV